MDERHAPAAPDLPHALGDGLVLRRATVDDTERLVAFNADIHREPGDAAPNAEMGDWVRDLLSGAHPTVSAADFLLVEDTATGAVASSLCLISQTWSYGGIPFGVGRSELVGTAPAYRERGLVRRQFATLHAWSAARGELVQAITGIPWYYRQFGYEHGGLTLGGSRGGFGPQVPTLPAGTEEPYRLRPATAADLPTLGALVARGDRRSLVAAVRDEALWRYELEGQRAGNGLRREWRVIETPSGETVGILGHPPRLWGSTIAVAPYELEPGHSWAAVTPSVVRYLAATGREYAARAPRVAGQPPPEWDSFAFILGPEHPVYAAFPARGLPRVNPPYAYFLRVPDLPRFIRLIAPVLERRLVDSALAGHSGDLTISFYRSGLRLAFETGRLATAEAWRPTVADGGKAAFPGLTFLQLLFGYRQLDELRYAFPDCLAHTDETQALLNALFPKQASHVMAIS